MSLHPDECALLDQGVASLDQSWGWTGWKTRQWPADVVQPGLRIYKYDLRPDRRELCALLEVTHGGSFTFRSMHEFVQHVERLTGRRPDPNEGNDSRSKWSDIEERLRECDSCTGLCLRWRVVKAVSIPLPGDFPRLGWSRLGDPNYGMQAVADAVV
jgi:hypothetical protein